jgi:hypothetical protein
MFYLELSQELLMKLNRIFLTLIVLTTAFAVLMPAVAAQRCVFMEDFTNASCPPCAAVNPSLRAMTSSLTHDTLVVVTYHVWWPGGDPMYSYNTPEVQSRVNFYVWDDDPGTPGIQRGVPHAVIDGTWQITPATSNISTIRNHIRTRYNAASPCTIDFSALATGETGVHVIGTVAAEQDMLSSNLRLFAALITDTMQYSSPPGSNGETLFPDVFRDLWPSGSGQAFTLSAGQTYDINATLVRAAAWNLDDLEVVVWVQDYAAQTVDQAAIAHLSRNYGMETATTSPRQLISDVSGGEVPYEVDLTNTGVLNDTYDVNLEGVFPNGWTHTVEAPGVPADPTHIQVSLASQQTATLTVRVNPSGHPGSADFDVHVTTPSEPLLSATESFRLMSGLDILLVDDDEGSNRETWYLNALADIGTNLVYGRWDVSLNPLVASYLAGIDVVIWFTGDGWLDGTTITAQDQILLGNYLDQGGRLFLSGQGIGADIGADPFFANYLHGIYRQNYPGHYDLQGIAGDPISEGLSLMISGGDGASNQTRQHSTDPDVSGLATSVFAWGTPPGLGGYPAHKVATDTYRIVYLGFGFEAINSAGLRDVVMQRSLNWLLPPGPPPPPENVTIGVVGNDLTLRWDAVPGATSYLVYSADTPDGSYSEDQSGTLADSSWTTPVTAARKFYYVTAVQ